MGDEKKEKYSSIFDAVSKIERKKAVDKVLSEDEPTDSSAQKALLLTDDEIAEKLDKYQKLHNLLADSLEQAFVKNNLSPGQLREYFDTPQNFTAEQWFLIEKERQNIDEMIARLVPQPSGSSGGVASKHDKADQKRPKKMQSKSRWLPMH